MLSLRTADFSVIFYHLNSQGWIQQLSVSQIPLHASCFSENEKHKNWRTLCAWLLENALDADFSMGTDDAMTRMCVFWGLAKRGFCNIWAFFATFWQLDFTHLAFDFWSSAFWNWNHSWLSSDLGAFVSEFPDFMITFFYAKKNPPAFSNYAWDFFHSKTWKVYWPLDIFKFQ